MKSKVGEVTAKISCRINFTMYQDIQRICKKEGIKTEDFFRRSLMREIIKNKEENNE